MNPDGSLKLEAIERQARSLSENGVNGAFICGTTGEGLALTTPERMRVAERWVAVAPERLKVIVHVGHPSVEESHALATHAQSIGAHAIAAMTPAFIRPERAEEVVEFCARAAAGAPSLPFYYYHFPALTRVEVPVLELLKLAATRIRNFAGVKFTDENLMSYAQCLNYEQGRFNILFGRDEILLAALALGAGGAVGSTYNFMAPVYHRLIAAFKSSDLESARRFQAHAIEIIAIMSRRGGLAAGKAMMKIFGIDCGPVRPPLRNLGPDELMGLEHELARAGFPFNQTGKDAGRAGK